MVSPCKRQLKATRHLICGSCSNWVDFVKSGCEKSWAEVQADSFSFECRGCTKMKELEVELEELRLLVVAMVGREQGGCASSSGGRTVDDKVGKDTRYARESSPQPGRKLRGGKVTGRTRVEQVILSGILPVMGRRGHKYRNCRGMAINMLVQKLCREKEVGFVDLWGSFVGRADMYMKDGLHLSGKGAAVFADKLSAAVDSDLGTMTNIFGSKHSLN